MIARTDLALERHEQHGGQSPDGVRMQTERQKDAVITKIEILDETGARALEKPVGTYYTIETDGFPDSQLIRDGRLQAVTQALRQLLPEKGPVLVAGLGNPEITPDALGPKCADLVFATRHIDDETRRTLSLPRLREVSVIAPGVTGQTGLEAVEVVTGVCARVRPAAVIAVDALAAASVKRLAKTVQLSDAGIEPGSGVGNARRALNAETLGVPVIAVGVPTVVDALSLAQDVFGEEAQADEEDKRQYASMIVTPRETDTVTHAAARLLALAINCALQPELEGEELLALM
ncbi:MAG: GPR endopeptidase [Clostridia bacterium]|nr:GPR endopeptidase [Clostridia bacterium]